MRSEFVVPFLSGYIISRVQISVRRPAVVTEDFCVFSSVRLGECRGTALKLGHDDFLLIPSYSSFTNHPYIRLCIVSVTEIASLTKLQINK
jgi:hypothetical protein